MVNTSLDISLEEPPNDNWMEQITFTSCTVSELLASLENFINRQQQKLVTERKELALNKVQISLHYILKTRANNYWDILGSSKSKSSFSPKHTCTLLALLENYEKNKDTESSTMENDQKKTPLLQLSSFSEVITKESESGVTQEHDPHHARAYKNESMSLLPYVHLIHNVIPSLTLSSIEDKCLNEEISCRFPAYSSKYSLRKEERDSQQPLTQIPAQVMLPAADCIFFQDLKDLQWKICKGIGRQTKKKLIARSELYYNFDKIFIQKEKKKSEVMFPLIDKHCNIVADWMNS
ncbi:uncharacterized protein LOC115081578 [Rhinatrema bivittatum]|uniref:uncharacterized protein LOC115081578 n=1 Tax=Rhinatrema bivittatum TaxID=194408 RepID=UPI00112C26B1|nr:uncharacterized protein LOC115081578 [Rhinatrema bivittatum]